MGLISLAREKCLLSSLAIFHGELILVEGMDNEMRSR